MSANYHEFEALVQSRRTHKAFAGGAISEADQAAILNLIRWAPNHRQTQPWRCYALAESGITRLDQFFELHPHVASWPTPGKEKKLAKLRSHYLSKLGFIIHLTSQKDADELVERENFAACAAAAQNALLCAEARGLASFWSSSAAMRHVETQSWLGVNLDQELFVGSLWFGNKCLEPDIPSRNPIDSFTTWIQ